MRRTRTRTLVAVLLLGCSAVLGAKTAREVAADRYKRAQTLLADLEAVPQVELGERQYLLVIDALKSVHRASPASSYCDDALLGVGDVYAAMIDRFGADPWRRKAVEAYNYLIQEYPHSSLLPKANQAIRNLESGARTTISQARRGMDPEDEAAERAAVEQPETSDAPAARMAAAEPPPPPSASPAAPADVIVRPASLTSPPSSLENRAGPTPASIGSGVASISAIRHYSHPDFTRIVIDADEYTQYKFDFLANPKRMYFDLLSARMQGDLLRGLSIEVGDAQVARIRAAQNRVNKARVVLDLNDDVYYDISWISNPPRLVIDLRGRAAAGQMLARAPVDEPPPPVQQPQSEPEPAPAPLPAPPVETAAVEPEKPKSFEEAFLALTAGRKHEQPAARAIEPVDEPGPTPPAERAEIQASALPRVTTEALPPVAPKPEPEVVLAKATLPEPPPSSYPENLPPPKPAEATSRGSQNLVRALGLKIGRVVIDAGHGGHDPGNIGPTGLQEKDVVLDISLRLGKLIEDRLGAEVVYTRQDDRFVELRDRPKVANKAQADLFVSVHANAYTSASVRGVETFYLNFAADPWALKVASRENAASTHSMHELQDLLSKIAQKENLEESREFATKMQASVYGGLSKETAGLRNRGVRSAPLIVLIGAKMPAILAEIGFLSNPTDEKLFKSGKYRDTAAEQLFKGIESYVKSLSSHTLTMTDTETASASLD